MRQSKPSRDADDSTIGGPTFDSITAAKVSADIERRFTYHAPKGDQPERYQALRARAKDLATDIATLTPASREQSLALTHLETAIFFANAAIARNE